MDVDGCALYCLFLSDGERNIYEVSRQDIFADDNDESGEPTALRTLSRAHEALPPGWEAVEHNDRLIFVDHNTKSTTSIDPRTHDNISMPIG